MPKKTVVLNGTADDAIHTLADQIRLARHHKGWTAASLAQRIGVTAATITAIESGHPGVAIGTVLNAASVVGVPLFAPDRLELARMRRRGEELVALIPGRTFGLKAAGDDIDLDF